jgi:hypothetical protein
LIEIFRIRFKEVLVLNNSGTVRFFDVNQVNNALNEYVAEGIKADYISGLKTILFNDFYEYEKIEINDIDNSEWTTTEKQNLVRYTAFLERHRLNFARIDNLKSIHTLLSDTFSNLIVGKINKEKVKAQKIDITFNTMLRAVDYRYLLYLINFNESETWVTTTIETVGHFDFEYFKDPILLQEFEDEKLTFLKCFKSFIKESLHIRRDRLQLKELPPIYNFINEYADSLVSTIPIMQNNTKGSNTVIQAVNIKFPKSIFETAADYQFFVHLMSFVSNTAQISFIYRTMAEKEKPPKILVKDTPFREWFNKQDFNFILDAHTKTLMNAYNEDRNTFYNAVKILIFKD